MALRVSGGGVGVGAVEIRREAGVLDCSASSGNYGYSEHRGVTHNAQRNNDNGRLSCCLKLTLTARSYLVFA